MIVWNLAENPSQLINLSAEEIRSRLFIKNDDLPDDVTRLPIKTIAVNKSPFVVRDLRVLKPERAAALKIDWSVIEQHAQIAKNLFFLPTMWMDVYQREKMEIADVDEGLYQALVPDNDRFKLNQFRQLDGDRLKQQNSNFSDPRLKELVFRYRARNFQDCLDSSEQAQWYCYCSQKINAQLDTFMKNYEEFQKSTDNDQMIKLIQTKAWVERRIKNLSSVTEAKESNARKKI
jgi:exodeoxyribonuclease-1